MGNRSKQAIRRRTGYSGRTPHASAASWSASQAAFRVVAKRAEIIERASDNPVLILNYQSVLRTVLDVFTERLIGSDCAPDQAPALALSLITDSSGFTPRDPHLIARLEQSQRRRSLAPLKVGESYVISPAMHATVNAAAGTLTKENLQRWRSDDLLDEVGVLLLPEIQMVHADGRAVPDEVIMLSWSTGMFTNPLDRSHTKCIFTTAWFDGDGPILSHGWTIARRTAKENGTPLPSYYIIADTRLSLDIDDPDGANYLSAGSLFGSPDAHLPETESEIVGEYTGETIHTPDISEWMTKYLFAFMGLARQGIPSVRPYREMRGPDMPPRRYDEVRVVQLRSFTQLGDVRQEDGTTRQLHHRWVVRMHKVNQWYPSEGVHRIIWRGPFIKGPEGAPLLAGEKVQALVR